MKESPNGYSVVANIIISSAAILCSCSSSDAQPKSRAAAEKWVAERVQRGEIADLNEFPGKPAPSLRGSVLRELLTSQQTVAKKDPGGVQIRNATFEGVVDLARMEIPCDLSLENCVFKDDVTFNYTHLKRNLFLTGTTFNGAADFNYVEIDNILKANLTNFAADKTANFDSLKAGRDVFFKRATFNGKLTFAFASIVGDLVANGAKFRTIDAMFFNNMRIGGSVYLGEDIFTNESGTAITEPATVDGRVDFRFAHIGGNFYGDGIQFNSSLPQTTFTTDSMLVTGHIFLRKALFSAVADFRRTHAGGNFEVSESRFEQPPIFQNVYVGDTAYFDETTITGLANFEGMRYQFIGAGSNLKDLFENHSIYNSDVYANLEDVFQRHGETDTAKYFHISGRERARSARWKNASFVGALEWVWDGLQDTVSGYGRHLERALYWSVLFIVFGSIVFRKEEWMETQNQQEAERYEGRYRPLWYSIALFLPIVNLPDAKVWMPQRSHRFRRMYMRVHIILGYLLIPIGVAAWTGIIK